MRSRSDPLSPSSLARCNLNNLSPSRKVDPKSKASVRRLAKIEKRHVFSQKLAGVTMDGSYGSIAALGQAGWFVDKIKAHNADVESFKDNGNHLNPGFCFRNWQGSRRMGGHGYWGWNLFFCKNEFGMIIFYTVGLNAETFPLCYSIVSKESEPSHVQTWKGFVTTAFYFMRKYKVCDKAHCKLCAEVRAISEHPRYHEFTKSEEYEKKIFPVVKALSDMVPCFYNFVVN